MDFKKLEWNKNCSTNIFLELPFNLEIVIVNKINHYEWQLSNGYNVISHGTANLLKTAQQRSEIAYQKYIISNIKKVKPYTLTPLSGVGDLFTLRDFVNDCLDDCISNDDGFGYYATETEVTNIPAIPSDILDEIVDTRWTHVEWYNK